MRNTLSTISAPYLILLFGVFMYEPIHSQEWQGIENLEYPVTRIIKDSSENLLYLGGGFKYFDTTLVNGIVAWNGAKAYSLGQGRTSECDNFSCIDLGLLVKYQGEVYIGLVRDSISGVPVKGIARWDGIHWKPVGNGLSNLRSNSVGIPRASEKVDGKLIIGGAFEIAGSDTIYSLASWDGSEWSGFNVPKPSPGNVHFINCISFFKGDLYIAGNFIMNLDQGDTHDIAVYKNGSWRSVGGGIKGGSGYINDIVVYKNDLYVCGNFSSQPGNMDNKIMRWDGNKWEKVGGGICGQSGIAERLKVHNGLLYMVGIFSCVADSISASCIATWDGAKWCSLGNSEFNNKILDIEFWNDDIYIGGGFTQINNDSIKFFAKWIGDTSSNICEGSTTSVKSHKGNFNVDLIPNPTSNYSTLRFSEPYTGQIQVFDGLGRQVYDVQIDGKYEVELDAGDLPAGLYQVYCSGMKSGVLRWMVVR